MSVRGGGEGGLKTIIGLSLPVISRVSRGGVIGSVSTTIDGISLTCIRLKTDREKMKNRLVVPFFSSVRLLCAPKIVFYKRSSLKAIGHDPG